MLINHVNRNCDKFQQRVCIGARLTHSCCLQNSAMLFLCLTTRLSYLSRMVESNRPLVSVTLGLDYDTADIPQRYISHVSDKYLAASQGQGGATIRRQRFGFLLHPSGAEGSVTQVVILLILDNELLPHSSPRWKIKMWNGVWCGTFSFGLIESLSQTNKHRKLQPPMDHKNIQKENDMQLNTSNHAIEILETEIIFFCYVLL